VPPILLIDTYSLFFRAFHALPAMQTSRGEPTSAVFGFSVLLLKAIREHAPAGLAFAMDAPQRTFRHERYAGYKGQRDAVPSALVAQLRRLDELLDALALPIFCVPGFEADDVLATLAARLAAGANPIIVISGDRDLLQVICGNVRVLFVGARGREPTLYDEPAVQRRFGLGPSHLPSWTALVGDSSDNLPGVPGIGPRTASALIRQFDSVANLLNHLTDVAPARVRDRLAMNAEHILLNDDLARLRIDVPLGDGPLHAPVQAAALARVHALFVELEFKSLLARLSQLKEGTA
jgi:DNA polymerase-1